jgi:hypothetical protein
VRRKFLIFLFTDIVGSTKILESSQDIALKTARKHCKIIEKTVPDYHGRIVNFYGDGSLSSFQSVVDALDCSVRLQKSFTSKPSIPVRIGLDMGESIEEANVGIFSSGINTAARIQSIGYSGSILFSSRLKEAIGNQSKYSFHFIGKRNLHGIKKAVEIYALTTKGTKPPALLSVDDRQQKTDHPEPIEHIEISRYWESKEDATPFLHSTFLNFKEELLICGITLNTVALILRNDIVLDILAEKFRYNQRMKITLIFHQPESGISFQARNREKARDLVVGALQTLENVQEFQSKLAEKFPEAIKQIDLRYYNRVNPSHFLIKADNEIFISPYLSSQTKGNSFLMQLRSSGHNSLYNYYAKEIAHILKDSLWLNE